jgi:hypothetical protein
LKNCPHNDPSIPAPFAALPLNLELHVRFSNEQL